jgi:pimeloyl-ACP methyl ester carboxylesterase
MHFIFDTDEAFSFETLRAVGYTPYGGADIGEIITTAERITHGDWESWYREWRALADRIADVAGKCAADGHSVSAAGAYLRASNYYRTAEFFLRDDPRHDPRVADTSTRAIEAFRSAAQIQGRWERVRIPYEGVLLEGYYLNVSGDDPGPTLLAHGGFDSTVEELAFALGEAAGRYGWNCLIFEGPGQGSALRVEHLPFRYDWEAVVSPVVDFALTLRGVDADRIALVGMSMGGYLAPRAAAFEHRLAACIAYDGLFDFNLTAYMEQQHAEQDSTQRIAAMNDVAAAPTQLRWLLLNARWAFDVSAVQELLAEVAKYDLTDVAAQITCPTLVCEAENDQFSSDGAAKLYEALRCPKTYSRFTAAEGAGEHCSEGALTLFHQRMFDWLDDTVRA